MVLLSLIASAVFGIHSHAYVDDELNKLIDDQIEANEKLLCYSTDEYQKTLDYLRSLKEVAMTENAAREISDNVSKNCDGAAERFGKVLTVMKASGLSDRTSLAFAMDFSSRSDETMNNFVEIFTKSFLAEFFDFDYKKALGVALEMSRDYHGDPIRLREDYIALVKFCADNKELDLPMQVCSEYSLRLARLSQHFADGIHGPFLELYKVLRSNESLNLNVQSALEVAYKVLQSGPRAPENFITALKYATDKKGLDTTQGEAMEFALKMASRSHLGELPPIYSPIRIERGLANVADPK